MNRAVVQAGFAVGVFAILAVISVLLTNAIFKP
jgi:hypothetical protein